MDYYSPFPIFFIEVEGVSICHGNSCAQKEFNLSGATSKTEPCRAYPNIMSSYVP
jgi:hypothetical protein